MKDIQINQLDSNQRRLLQFAVLGVLLIFLLLFFMVRFQDKSTLTNNSVYIEQNTLHIFNDKYPFSGYPDKILINYPYFVYVQANKSLSIVYNLETHKKETEVNDIVLDYYDGNILLNKKETIFNDKELNRYCDNGFIKSSKEILCITKKSEDAIDNMLISINPEKPNLWKQIYQSGNLLTSVSVISNKLYIGEINRETQKNYISVNKKLMATVNIVNIIYPLQNQPYFASFPSILNNQLANYYLIEVETVKKIPDNKILFYNK